MGIPPQMPSDPMRTQRPEPGSYRRTRVQVLATSAVLAIVLAVVVIIVL